VYTVPTERRVDDQRDDGDTQVTVGSHRLARQSRVASPATRPAVHHHHRHLSPFQPAAAAAAEKAGLMTKDETAETTADYLRSYRVRRSASHIADTSASVT